MPLDAKSQSRLNGAWHTLQTLFTACAADPKCPVFTILDAQRGKAAQETAFNEHHSRAHFGQSPHNFAPALALDVVPFPPGKVDWNDLKAFQSFAKFVLAKAAALDIAVTWGGSWPKLKDMPHFEVSGWQQLVAAKKVKPYGA